MNTKNVIVTGSSRGIGQAVAMEFAKAGYNLVINSRNVDELSASKEEILKAIDGSVEIVTSPGDISQEHVCKRLMDVAEKKLGGLDVLVNKAGINGPEKNTTDISSTEWDKVLDINLKGSFFCSREAIKKMLSQMKRREYSDYSIINISSVHQTTPMPLALYWDTGDQKSKDHVKPYHYARVQRTKDKNFDLLIVGGEDHKTGIRMYKNDFDAKFKRLELWMRKIFSLEGPVIYAWSGQVMEPLDGLAFIGPNPGDDKNIYIATGDSGNGMTHGTIAGIILCDLIQGKDNPWANVYRPDRKIK